MQDYNFIIKHIPGESNKSDTLSRQPDYNKGDQDNLAVTIPPPELFIQSTTLLLRFDRTSLNTQIHRTAPFICLFSLSHTKAHVRYDLKAHS